VGDDESVVSAVEPERPATGEPRSYDVRRLEFAGPKESGVVDALFGRVVHCPLDVHDDAPLPPDVWTRAKLALPHGNQVVAIVGSNKRSVEEAVAAFTARAKRVDDYEDTAYHFLRYGDL
jgi:hypothetical protein